MRLSHILSLCITVPACTMAVQGPTDAEIAAFITTVPVKELNLVYNLIYRSWERSMTTCATQTAAIDGLTAYWNRWHAYAHQRLDPSRTIIIGTDVPERCSSACALQEQFALTNRQYSSMVHYAIHPTFPWSAPTVRCIDQIRSTARSIVAQKISAEISSLKEEIAQLFTAQEPYVTRTSEEDCRHILSAIVQYFTVNSLRALDETLLAQSDQFFALFITSQKLINRLWHLIESTRAAYYKALCIRFYTAMRAAEVPDAAFQRINFSSGTLALDTAIITISSLSDQLC